MPAASTTARNGDRSRASWRACVTVVLLLAAAGCTPTGIGTSDDHAGSRPAPTRTPGTPTRTPQDPVLSPRPGEVIELDQRGPEYVFTRAGRYAVRLTPDLTYEVDAPDMWEVRNGRFFSSSEFSGGEGIFVVAAAPSGKTWLPTHPCLDRARVRVGPSPRDLADSLWEQPTLRVTRPAEITIGDKKGLHIRITVPDHLVTSGCVGGDVALYSPRSSGNDWWTLYGGAEARILDVHRERWVILTTCDETCSRADIARLAVMADSVTFIRDQ